MKRGGSLRPVRRLVSCAGRQALVLAACGLAASVAGCKIEKTVVRDPSQTATSVFINDASFNPDAMVQQDWDAKVLPMVRQKAGDYDEVADLVAKDPDAAGERFGYREKQAGSPWSYAARIDGTVTAANTESRAATIEVRTAGGKAVTLQIGPIVRGTAIRDMLAFRPFGSFKNQVDYAQFGKALNQKANASALSTVPRQDLVGRTVKALGVFTAAPAGTAPLVTPVEITVGAKP